MSTNAGFNLPSDPPCPTDVMTATALVALRNAGSLDVRCHYFVQGPVIGTPGNTSPTVLELHAVTASTLSKEAMVRQNFNPEGAFIGSYDPDADTANGGTLNELLDHWDNRLSDEDAGNAASHTVHNQWPYHLSGTLLRDNMVNDCDLPGLAPFVAAGASFTDNTLQESTVDLTGVTSPGPAPMSFFLRNQLQSSTFKANCPTVYGNNNTMSSASVQHLGTAAGSFSFQGNTMLSGFVTVDAATTSQVTLNNNVVGGTSGGSRINVTGKTGGLFIFSGNRIFNQGFGSYEVQGSGSGTISVTANEIGAGTMTLSGPGNATLTSCGLTAAGITQGGAGNLTLNRAKIDGSTLSHLGGGNLSSTDLTMQGNSRVLVLAGQTGALSVGTSLITRAYTLQVEATSAAQLTVAGCHFTGHTSHASGVDFQVDGSGLRLFNDTKHVFSGNQIGMVLPGSGIVSIGGCDFPAGRIVRDPATSANLSMNQTRMPGTVQQDAGATSGALNISGSDSVAIGLTVNQRGPGSMDFNSCRISGLVRNSATATRGLSCTGCDFQGGTFNQNRTGGTGLDSVFGMTMRSNIATATLAGAVDPGASQVPFNYVSVDSGGQVTLTDPAVTGGANVVMQNTDISGNAVVSGTGTGLVQACRFAAGCVVNLGAFGHDHTVVEGAFSKTFTAGNANRLCNKAFDDVV